MDSDRYLLTEDNKTMRDVAAQVPYDAILIMVNSKRYGGGALFGCFSTFTTDGPWSEYVFHHEFAHAFAFLADEYYASEVAYSEFFPPGIEPAEPNLTALLDPQNLKWKELVSPGLALPTPWGKEHFDSLNVAVGALGRERRAALERMRKEGASEKQIQEADREFSSRSEKLQNAIRQFMMDHPLSGKIGAFEGGGFAAKGFYRPTVNSLMNQFNTKDKSFYGVNEQAIIRVINYYSER
jgi:hypothetical protein